MLQGKLVSTPPTARSRERRLLTTCAVGLALVALALAPDEAFAQVGVPPPPPPPALQGTSETVGGQAVVTRNGPSGTLAASDTIRVTTPTAVINWVPFDPTGTGTIDFLPSGTLGTFIGPAGFTVLNRVLPSRVAAIALNGTVNSFVPNPTLGAFVPGGNVWFYSPNGVIAGGTSVFNVGGLVLTTADIPFTTGPTGGIAFGPGGSILFGSGPNGTIPGSSVIVNAGAQIRAGIDAQAAVQNNYVVMVAPRVEQLGLVNVNGSIAYVGAEAATLSMNAGLFDITITTGTIDPNGVVHGGSSIGPATTSSADAQRVYMTTLAKNTAVTMLVGGIAGYTPAGTAVNEAGAVVLSAAYDIDDGAIALSPSTAGTGANNITIAPLVARGTTGFASDVFGRATGTLDVRPGTGRGLINFRQDATLTGDRAATILADGSVLVGGSLALSSAGTAIVQIDAPEFGYGGLLDVGGDLTLDAGATGIDMVAPGGSGGNATGGIATLFVNGGTLNVDGTTLITADALGGAGTGDAGDANGGSAALRVTNGGRADLVDLTVSAAGRGGNGRLGNATGGAATITVESGTLTALGATTVDAGAIGGAAGPSAAGAPRFEAGDGRGGAIDFNVTGGVATINALFISANGTGGTVDSPGRALPNTGLAGDGFGGTIAFDVTGGALTTTTTTLSAVGRGSDGRVSDLGLGTNGGTGTGGTITAALNGTTATFSPGVLVLSGLGRGGNGDSSFNTAAGTAGGNGIGGSVRLDLLAGVLNASAVTLDADGTGGIGGANFADGNAGAGGAGTGGRAELTGGIEFFPFSLVVESIGSGGAGGVAGTESGYGTVYGVGAGGGGGAGTGGTGVVTLSGGSGASVFSLSTNGSGGAGGGGAIGGAGGAGTGGTQSGVGEGGVVFTQSGGISRFDDASFSSIGLGGLGGIGAIGAGGAGGAGVGGTVGALVQGGATSLSLFSDERVLSFAVEGIGGAGGTSGLNSTGGGAAGASGGDGIGGAIDFVIEDGAEILLAPDAIFTANGVGGAASVARPGRNSDGGRGGNGGGGIGGTIAVTLSGSATLGLTFTSNPFALTFDASGIGADATAGGDDLSGDGGIGGDGGFGGDAAGGSLRFDLSSEAQANLSALVIDIDAVGGNGGAAGTGSGDGGTGGDGGDADAGTTSFSITGSSTAGLGAISLTGTGIGGAGGVGGAGVTGGGDGGAGGNAIGADATITLAGIDFDATSLTLVSSGEAGTGGAGGNGTGNRSPGGSGGRGGDGTGGLVEFRATDSNFDFASVDLQSNGQGGNGGEAGLGTGVPGTPGNPGATPPVPPVPPVPPINGAVGLGGDAFGGRLSISSTDDGASGSFTRNLGSVSLGAGSQGGISGLTAGGFVFVADSFGGRVELNDTSTAEGGALTIDSLTVNAAGSPIVGDEGFFLTGGANPLAIDGDLDVNVGGNAEFNIAGIGTLRIGGDLNVSADGAIIVRHADQPGEIDSIVAGNASFNANGLFRSEPGTIVRARGNLFVAGRFDGVEASDLRALDVIAVSTVFGDITLGNATVTGAVSDPPFDGPPAGGRISIFAGIPDGTFETGGTDVTITGAVDATGTVLINAGGVIRVTNGATVFSDNRIEFASGDDIIVETGATVRAALDPLPEFGYGSSGDPLGSPALLSFTAGVPLSSPVFTPTIGSIIIDGEISAVDRAISLTADAIQADNSALVAKSLFANVTSAPPVGVTGSNDGGQLRPDCVEGNICLGDLAELTGILQVGPANRISIRATDVQVETIDIVARDALTIGVIEDDSIFSANDSLRLTSTLGDVTLNRVLVSSDDLGVTAGGSLLGSGILTSASDVGISVGDSIVATAIDAGGELTEVDQIGGDAEGFYSLAGSFQVGSVNVGGGFDLGAGGSIDIGTLGVAPGSLVDLTAGGSAFLGGAGGGGQPVSIAIAGTSVGFGGLSATDTIILAARAGSIDGGSLGAASVDLDAAEGLFVTSVSGDLDADAGDLAQFGSITGNNASIGADSIFVDNLNVGSANLNTGGSLVINSADVGSLNATAGSFDIGTLSGSGSVDIAASASGAIDVATIGTAGSLTLSANGITLGSATAGQSIALISTSFVAANALGAGTSLTIDADGAVDLATANAGSFIAIDAAGGIALRDAISTGGSIRLSAGGASSARTIDAFGSISGTLDGGLAATSLFARQGGVTLVANNGGLDIGSIDSRLTIDASASGLIDIDSALTRGSTVQGSTSPAGILARSTGGGVTIGTANSAQNIELTAQGALAAGNLTAVGQVGLTGGSLAFDNATAGGFVEGRAVTVRGGTVTAGTDAVLIASSGALAVGNVNSGDDIVIAATGAGTGATVTTGILRSTGAASDTATGPITFQGGTGPNGAPIAGAGPAGAIIRVTGTGAVATGAASTPGRIVIASQQGGIDAGALSANGGIATLGGGNIALGAITTTGAFVVEGSAAAAIIADSNDPAALLSQAQASLPGAVSVNGVIQAGTILIATDNAIALGRTNATGTVTLNAARGAVGVTDLRAGGAVDARGTALTIASGGGALGFSNALASAGAIDLDTVGALSVTNATATGAIALESDSDVILTTATGGAGIEIDAARDATLTGAVTATGLLDVAATRIATINGASTGASILIGSGDIVIGTNGRLGTAQTGLLTLRDIDPGRPTFIGGAANSAGYSLSADEMLRLQADNITIFGGRVEAKQPGQVGSARAPDVIVGAFTLAARNGNTTGQIGQAGTLRIETPGKLRVTGAAALTSMASANRFEISALEALEIDALAGSIDLRAGGALGGTLFLQSEDVIAASLAAIGDVGRATTTDAIDDRLAANDGPVSDDGVLRANGIEVSVTRGFFVQNTGAGDRFRERRGLTVGSGGLRINTGTRDTTGGTTSSTTTRIVINGSQVQETTTPGSTGFVTGVDFLRLVNINGATGGMPSGLDRLSTINGCGIANPSACFDFDVSPPLTNDIINRPLDPVGDFDESALTGSDLPTTLIELRDFEPFGFEPLIDEPVTGAGNDDLYIRDCEPGSDEPECEVPPEG